MWRRLDPSDARTGVALARILTVFSAGDDDPFTKSPLDDGSASKEEGEGGEEGKLDHSRSKVRQSDLRSGCRREKEADGRKEVRGRRELAAESSSSWQGPADGLQQDKRDVLAWVRHKRALG